jgi:diketogulonate reductase-like aldo/keto reductase
MEFVPFEQKYPPEWTNLEGKMVLVRQDMNATWKAMEGLVDTGLVKTIGVCNFSTQLLRQVFAICRIRPSTLQVELHPQNSQERLVRFAHEEGMNVTAFSAFGASSYIELNMSKEDDKLMNDPGVKRIAAVYNKTPAQILIRWALERNTFPLTKTTGRQRMLENRDVLDFSLTSEDISTIDALNKNRRYNDPGVFCEGMGTFCPIYD